MNTTLRNENTSNNGDSFSSRVVPLAHPNRAGESAVTPASTDTTSDNSDAGNAADKAAQVRLEMRQRRMALRSARIAALHAAGAYDYLRKAS